MYESLVIRFQSPAGPLHAREFSSDEGLVFDDRADASPLNIAIGLRPRLPHLLDAVRQRRDWRDGQYRLDAALEDGALRLSGYQGDPEGLPAGPYEIAVEVESFRFRDSVQRIVINSDEPTTVTLHHKPDLRRIHLRDNVDPLTAAVLHNERSVIDGEPLRSWLANPAPRAARQACLLNVLAKMRVPPGPSLGFREPLVSAMRFAYFADVDRVYAAADAALETTLRSLVDADLWKCEGTPKAPIHRRLLDSLTGLGLPAADAQRFTLTSYRQGGRNCLQIVTAAPPAGFADRTVYADIDIDLGNPLWDLEGLLVHLGELLDPGSTDHFALGRTLQRGATSDFLYYDVVSAKHVAG